MTEDFLEEVIYNPGSNRTEENGAKVPEDKNDENEVAVPDDTNDENNVENEESDDDDDGPDRRDADQLVHTYIYTNSRVDEISKNIAGRVDNTHRKFIRACIPVFE